MVSRFKTALAMSVALLAAAPVLTVAIPTAAYAQAGAADVESMISNAVTAAVAALGANPSEAAIAEAQTKATQAALVQAAKGVPPKPGASAEAIKAALKAAEKAGTIPASVAMTALLQATAQLNGDPTASSAARTALSGAVTLASADADFMADVAGSGGLNVAATTSTGAPTVLTDLASVMNAISGGDASAPTIVVVPPQYDPCDNIQGDYC